MRKKFRALSVSHSSLCDEWDYDLNKFTPDRVTEVTSRKAWWRCKRGHSYKEKITERVKGLSCPKCVMQSSYTERSLMDILKLEPMVVITPYKWNGANNYADCDGVCEQTRLIVEYDGYYWHKDKKGKDINKTRALIDSGYSVVRIREKGLFSLVDNFEHNYYREICNVDLNTRDKDSKSLEFDRVIRLSKKHMRDLENIRLDIYNSDVNTYSIVL